MLSLFFIQFLVFTAYCHSSLINQVIEDPVAFTQTFSEANPAQIKEVINIINGLIDAGNDKRDGIIGELNAATQALNKAKSDLAAALDAFEQARGERKLADELVVVLAEKLQQLREKEAAALNSKNLAFDVLTDAKNWLAQESARIDGERKIFEEVIDTLRGLKDVGRRLLSSSSHLAPILPALIESAKLNPKSVDKVIDMIVHLINAGEDARAKAKAALATAQDAFDTAEAAWKAAVAKTIEGQTKSNNAGKDALAKLQVEEDKEAIWDKASKVKAEKQDVFDEKLIIKNREVPVIDHEDEELKKVIRILENMIKQ